MIEAWADEGPVIVAVAYVKTIHYGDIDSDYGAWANVVMDDGKVHRFKGSSAKKVVQQYRAAMAHRA